MYPCSSSVGSRSRTLSSAITAVVAIALTCAIAHTAHADAGAEQTRVAQQSGKSDRNGTYRRLYRKGREFFTKERWAAARKQFEKALEIRREPILFFNIASTYRREGNDLQALFYYHRYLEEAGEDARHRRLAESTIAELEARIAERKARAEAAVGDKAAAEGEPEKASTNPDLDLSTPAPGRDQPPPDGGSRALRYTGLTLLVLATGGVGYGLYEFRRADAAGREIAGLDPGTPWTPELQARYDQGEAADLRGTIAVAAGGATFVLGTILYLLGRGDSAAVSDDAPLTLAPQVGSRSVGIVVRSAF